jgi:NAD(P)-dependent dehydrogenase (short-subunit alcohol dehydrogenase family)
VTAIDAPGLLRADLLSGVAIALAGGEVPARDAPSAREALSGESPARDAESARGGSFAGAVRSGCAALGARVLGLAPVGEDGVALEETTLDTAVAGLLGEAESIEMLVIDAAGLFARESGRDALVGSMEVCWNVTRALVNGAFLASELSPSPPPARRVVYIAPRPGAGEHAEAMRAALENLARTLSIEWSRHAITPVAIAPGDGTAASEVAALVAYLASPAGAYFSGCELDLRGPAHS